MENFKQFSRRRFAAGAMTLSVCSLAGCSGAADSEETTNGDSEQSTNGNETHPTTETTTTTPAPASFDVSVEAPKVVNADESFRIRLTVENTGEKRGFFSTNLETRWTTETSWGNANKWLSVKVDAGETETKRVEITAPAKQGTLEYRVSTPETEATWTVDVVTKNATPKIQFANLVSDWSKFGDAKTKAIESASVGDPIKIATRYNVFSHNGTVNVAREIRIYETSTGDQVATSFDESESLVDYSGYGEWEFWQGFSTDSWDSGEYRAEITIRDNVSSQVSEGHETHFSLE